MIMVTLVFEDPDIILGHLRFRVLSHSLGNILFGVKLSVSLKFRDSDREEVAPGVPRQEDGETPPPAPATCPRSRA